MFRKTTAAFALCAALLTAPMARADLTAMQAWDAIRSTAEAFGQTVTGTPEQSGKTVTISNLTTSISQPEMTVTSTLGQIILTEGRDGSVTMDLPAEWPVHLDMKPKDGEPVKISLTMALKKPQVTLSGTSTRTVIASTMPELSITATQMQLGDTTLPINLSAVLSDAGGDLTITQGNLLSLEADTTIAKLLGNFAMDVPAEATKDGQAGSVRASFEMADLASSQTSTYPREFDPEMLSEMLKSGLATKASFTYGASAGAIEVQSEADVMNLTGTTASGALKVDMSSAGMTYGGTQKDIAFTFAGTGLPLPQISGGMDDSAFNLTFPVMQSDEPAPFKILATLRGLMLEDSVWGLVDPQAVLPLDPANLHLDLSGKAKLTADTMNPQAVTEMQGAPGELQSLDINALELTVAGASLTGTGGFTFDNSGTGAFGPMPAPIGTANLELTGANGLMDKLVQAGLASADQIMGLRMMLGMFARPGEGEDALVSEITVTPDGQVLANGQRIR